MKLKATYKIFVDAGYFFDEFIGTGNNEQECVVDAETALYRKHMTLDFELINAEYLSNN